MTVAGAKLPRRLGPFLQRSESFLLAVGGDTQVKVECHWQADEGAPVAILVHGLCGDARRGYMAGTAEKAWQRGFSVLRLNLRNSGGTEHLTPTLYHAAFRDDLHSLVDWVVRERAPDDVVVAGFSLGGSIVIHAAADWGATPPRGVRGVAAVSVPWDLAASSVALHRGGFNRFYIWYFMAEFRRLWPRKAELWPERYPPERMRTMRTLFEFDDRATAPAFGWAGADHYYEAASPLQRLPELSLPALVLHAEDDPFVPMTAESQQRLRSHPGLELLLEKKGGHNGFFGARPAHSGAWRDPDRWWAENRLVQAFSSYASLPLP